jgi:hypothetical protein
MVCTYELWETTSGNLVGTYSTQRDALDVIEQGIKRHGPHYADTFLLGYEEPDGDSHVLAEGQDLVDLACADERG